MITSTIMHNVFFFACNNAILTRELHVHLKRAQNVHVKLQKRCFSESVHPRSSKTHKRAHRADIATLPYFKRPQASDVCEAPTHKMPRSLRNMTDVTKPAV